LNIAFSADFGELKSGKTAVTLRSVTKENN
jgi:hypothetical protein